MLIREEKWGSLHFHVGSESGNLLVGIELFYL